MEGLVPIFVTIGFFLLLVFVSMPLGYALGLSAMLGMVVFWQLPIDALNLRMVDGISKWTFLAIPMFLLAGELMAVTGVIDVLVDLARALVGRFRGGLSHVSCLDSLMLAGIQGSSVVDVASTGPMMIPIFKKAGYPGGYAAMITAVTALLGPIIPPSIPMIFYSLVTGTSVSSLFLAGVIPGLMMFVLFIGVGHIMATKYNFPRDEAVPPRVVARRFGIALPALLVPIVLVGGMRTGLFTATEGGAILVAVVVIAAMVYRKTQWKELLPSLRRSAITVGAVLFVVALASAFAYNLSMAQMGPKLAEAVTTLITNKILVLLMINVVLLIMGCFLDLIPIMIIFGPILLPVVKEYGVDPVQFGLIMVINLTLGQITPPYGLCMLLSTRIANVSIGEFWKYAWPFFLGLAVILGLVTYVPVVTLFLPGLLGGK